MHHNADEKLQPFHLAKAVLLSEIAECHAVQRHKRAHYGCLPPKMRRLSYKLTMEGSGFITTLQADHEQLLPGMVQQDFDLNPHLSPDPTSMDE